MSSISESYPGLEQYAIKKFAEAFESVPKALAENSGQKVSRIVEIGRKFQLFEWFWNSGGKFLNTE